MKTGKIIQVYGRVQGVNFRYHAQITASKFNIHGFVRNEYDGSVYIEAEGEDADINNFIRYLCKGPVASRVVDIKITDNSLMNYRGFCVKY